MKKESKETAFLICKKILSDFYANEDGGLFGVYIKFLDTENPKDLKKLKTYWSDFMSDINKYDKGIMQAFDDVLEKDN